MVLLIKQGCGLSQRYVSLFLPFPCSSLRLVSLFAPKHFAFKHKYSHTHTHTHTHTLSLINPLCRQVCVDNLNVMDETAITLCKENNIPVIVFNIMVRSIVCPIAPHVCGVAACACACVRVCVYVCACLCLCVRVCVATWVTLCA